MKFFKISNNSFLQSKLELAIQKRLEEEEAIRARMDEQHRIELMNQRIKEDNLTKFKGQNPLRHKYAWGADQAKVI